ncbi:MAG: RecB-family nuclease, partial [Desulfurococcaceae archaeon]
MYIALYNTSSIQRLVDFVKIVCSFRETIPVIIKPIGAAAQIGVPEAYKIIHRANRPLIVLSEITD